MQSLLDYRDALNFIMLSPVQRDAIWYHLQILVLAEVEEGDDSDGSGRVYRFDSHLDSPVKGDFRAACWCDLEEGD